MTISANESKTITAILLDHRTISAIKGLIDIHQSSRPKAQSYSLELDFTLATWLGLIDSLGPKVGSSQIMVIIFGLPRMLGCLWIEYLLG